MNLWVFVNEYLRPSQTAPFGVFFKFHRQFQNSPSKVIKNATIIRLYEKKHIKTLTQIHSENLGNTHSLQVSDISSLQWTNNPGMKKKKKKEERERGI